MPAPLNAIDAISAAWNRAIQLLLHPFRWSFWWRMAFLAFMTGEMGGSGNFNLPSNWNTRTHSGNGLFALPAPWEAIGVGALVAIILAAAVFTFVFMYLSCVFRFVLFDAVLTGRYRLREGFARWQAHGGRFFWWSLGYMFVMLASLGVGVLIIVASIAGVKTGNPVSILLLVVGVILILCLLVVAAVIYVLTKDFVIPIMAFDGGSTMAAWGTLRRMIAADPVSYLAYIGMKIVLAMGAGIVTGIATLIVLLVIGVPVGIVAAIVIAGGHLTWNPVTILLAVVFGGIAFCVLMFLLGLIAAPVVTFFQAYAIHFFGRRFRPMELAMYPEPLAPPAPVAPPPIEPGPAPAPA
jgi:hypothetical protein